MYIVQSVHELILWCWYSCSGSLYTCALLSSLHKHLDQEECAYTQAKVVVDKHRQRLAERKQALKLAEQELAHDLRKVSKELTDTHQVTLVDEVQASLKEASMVYMGGGGWG